MKNLTRNQKKRALGETQFALLTVTLLMVATGTVACGSAVSGDADGGGWQAETTTEGNVTTVHTLSGSVWGAPAQLVENLSIGVDQGEDAHMFGRIAGVASTDEYIYVLDRDVPALRVYDRQGNYVRDIGAEGDGPGEFRRPDSLLVAPDGRLFVRSMNQGRITVFTAAGELDETRPLEGGFMLVGPGTGMVMTADGKVYSPGRIGDMPTDFSVARMLRVQLGMVPRGVDGVDGEPIPRPEFDYEPRRFTRERRSGGNVMVMMQGVPFSPQIVWTLAPSGAMIAGVGREYSFDITYPSGQVTRVVKDAKPIDVAPAEGAWYREQVTAQMRDGDPEWVWEGADLPTVKPAYDQLIADLSGRIWVERPGPGYEVPGCEKDPETGIWEPSCWRDERLYEVFDVEGQFLGTVEVPGGLRLDATSHIRGDEIVTQMEDDLGVITVKRYQLVTPN